MKRTARRIGVLLAALCALLVLHGCPSDTTTTNTLQLPSMVQIRTAALPGTLVGASYAQTLDTAGGSGSYVYSIESGSGHAWLAIDPDTGEITGTPEEAGEVEITVLAEDAEDAANYDRAFYRFSVHATAYPGSPVADSNHADDGLAFSPSGLEPYIGAGAMPVLFFPNHANGGGVALVKMMNDLANDGEGDPEDRYSLWASYFDGNALTPLVEILGSHHDPSHNFDVGKAKVVFLNGVSGRDGDALITYTMRETDPDAGGTDDVRLYASYFDLSAYGDAVSGSDPAVRYGFDTAARLVNDDRDGYDVDGVLLFTDGLWIESITPGSSSFLSARTVSTAGVAWTETGTGAGADPDGYLCSAPFDVSAANTDDAFSAASDVTTDATLDDQDTIDPDLSFTGRTLFYRVEKNGEASGFDNRVLEAAAWNAATGLFENPARLTRTDVNSTVVAQDLLAASGDIQGLAKAYAVGFESGYDVSGYHADQDLMLYTYDPSDGTHETMEIDAHATNAVDSAVGYAQVRLNRTGSVLWIGWVQRHSDAEGTYCLFLQAVQTVPSGGTDRTLANAVLASPVILNARQSCQNPIILEALSFATAHGFLEEETVSDGTASGQVLASLNATTILVSNTNGVGFTIGQAATGATSGYSDTIANILGPSPPQNYAHVRAFSFPVSLQYGIGFASDPLEASLLFLQSADTVDVDNAELRTARLGVTLDATGSAPPSAVSGTGSATDTLVWTNDTNHPFWNMSGLDMNAFRILDSGTAGKPVLYFLGDGDGAPGHETTTEESETRLFVWDARKATPQAVEISGDGTDTGQSTLGFSNARQVAGFGVQPVPVSLYAGAGTETAPPTHHHVFVREARDAPGSAAALRHRCFDLGSSETSIEQQFFPALTAQPFDVDCGGQGDAVPYLGRGPVPVNGTTVALYFQQGAHVWYNEYAPGAGSTWLTEGGLPAPRLVDDQSPESALWYLPVPCFSLADLDLIGSSPVFYLKLAEVSSFNVVRLFARVHD